MRVLFLSNVPSPYMVDFFNEFGKLCDLTVVFEKRTSSERDESWERFKFLNFKGVVLNGYSTSVDSALSVGVLKYLKRNLYDHIVVTNPATPTGIIAIFYMKLFNIPYAIESEGSFPKDGKGLKEKFKKAVMSGANYYLSTTPKADEYFLAYGAPKEKIEKYPFTSIYKREVLEKRLTRDEKSALREKLGLTGETITIAVGRFVSLKRFDVLIEVWEKMNPNNMLYIIGGGPEKENYLEIINRLNIDNVVLLEFMDKALLFEHYKAADLFIHPTSTDVWGLVINEAMACGLPVITTDMCIAGHELIDEGKNGYLVPLGKDDELLDKAKHILESPALIESMSEHSLNKIINYTFEDMASEHFKILKGHE